MKGGFASGSSQTITTYGFNVPCQRFLITANITRDRRLPVVDEFILRLLKIADRIPVGRLAGFFGFSPTETLTVLADLQARGLVSVCADDVELTSSAHELFVAGRAGGPELVQVETWAHRLWFDLISRNMMAPERARPLDNLIDLKPASTSREMAGTFARKAFEQNFPEFLRKIARVNNPDNVALYSVSDVTPDRFGSIVLSGSVELVLDPEPRIVQRLLDVDVDDRARYRPLSEAMSESIRRLHDPDPSQAGLAEFRKLTGDQTVTSHFNAKQYFDPTAWLADPRASSNIARTPIFGASYLARNLEAFLQSLERRGLDRLKGEPPRTLNLRWFRPGGASWGASYDLQKVMPALTDTVRKTLSPEWSVSSTLVAPAGARKEAARFGRLFDAGVLAPANHLAATTEIVIIEGVSAIVATRVLVARDISIPIGFVLSAGNDIAKLEANLIPAGDSSYESLWDKRGARNNSANLE